MNGNYYFRYSKTVPKEYAGGSLSGANLAYVNVPELDPSTDTGNLRIIDRSYVGFPENSVLFADSIVTYEVGTGSIVNDSYNFLLTSEYGNASVNNGSPLTAIDVTIPIRPLWYIHRFGPDYVPDRLPNGSYNIRIFDDQGTQIASDHYKFDSTTSPVSLYTDLINTTDKYYTLVYMSGRAEVRRLLSVEPLYTRSYSDSPSSFEYTLSSNPAGDNRWVVTVGNSNIQYSIKNIGTTKIAVKHPIQVTSTTDPWYVQITNGYFKRILNGNVYEYYLPEYSASQSWKPKYPFKLQAMEKPIFIDNHTLRLKQTPLAKYADTAATKTLHIYVRKSLDRTSLLSNDVNALINDLGAQTTTAQAAVYLAETTPLWDSILWQELEVEDIDRNSGIVKISGLKGTGPFNSRDNAIYATDEIVACYYYIEEEYTFSTVNFNPLTNQAIRNGGISIYLRPAKAYGYYGVAGNELEGSEYIASATIGWLRFDENEEIKESSSNTADAKYVDDFYLINDGSCIPQEGFDHTKFVELARVFISPSSAIRDIRMRIFLIRG
jgi:hypothetical protein